MKILLIAVGTRGDMEPFIAVGQQLSKRGNEVIAVFPEQFRGLAQAAGLGFRSLGTEFIAMVESDLGKRALGGGGSILKKLPIYFRLAMHYRGISKSMILDKVKS